MSRLRTPFALAVVCVALFGATLLAHEFKGTVVTASPTAITIAVVDESTKKPVRMTFDLNKDTKIQRGTKTVSFTDAHIEKGEKVAVTIDHEMDEKLAVVVKLDAKK